MTVKNKSQGFNYSYASLADIANQGYEIPKMKTVSENGKEYVAYLDGEEWIRGAEIVIPESKSMNKAQLYGSALTYARRYTTLLALSLACEDDKNIEDIDESGEKKTVPKATAKQISYIEKLYDAVNIAKMLKYYGVEQLADLNVNQAKEAIEKALKRNEEHNQQL